jgi:hypothetical protein
MRTLLLLLEQQQLMHHWPGSFNGFQIEMYAVICVLNE